jgi:hypothetical protein
MAQADYVISPNPTGLAMRTEVNQIFQAILTSNAGNVAPSTTQAGMLWGDTGNSSTYYLKIRNHTNDGWASLYAYDVATKTIQPMLNETTLSSNLALKANLASPTFTGTVSGITKSMIGLSNVDNTSDINKPISTASQTALDLKAPINNPAFTGTVSGITSSMIGLGSVNNTSDTDKPVSTATQTALNLKANLSSPALIGTPTAPTASAGTNNTQLATTQFACSMAGGSIVPSLSNSANGYMKMANGIIVQWVNVNVGFSNPYTFNFPITFPNAVFTVVPNGGETSSSWIVHYRSATTSSCSIGISRPSGYSGSLNIVCIAIGY